MGTTTTTNIGYIKPDQAEKNTIVFQNNNWDLADLLAGQVVGKNILINDNFLINTLEVTGSVVLLVGEYGHDGWKAGASGCTYTFSTIANLTTITISAGSLTQVIEGIKLESSSYTFSWNGTATGNIESGSDLDSPITDTLTGGTNATVEIKIGTLSLPKLEKGTIKTQNNIKTIDEYLKETQRYAYKINATSAFGAFGNGLSRSTVLVLVFIKFLEVMRSASYTLTDSGSFLLLTGAGNVTITDIVIDTNTPTDQGTAIECTVASIAVGTPAILAANNDANAFLLFENRL